MGLCKKKAGGEPAFKGHQEDRMPDRSFIVNFPVNRDFFQAAADGEVAAFLTTTGLGAATVDFLTAAFLTAAFLATGFFTAAFLVTGFFTAAFLATGFFTAAFFTTVFFTAAFFATGLIGAAFFAASLAGAFLAGALALPVLARASTCRASF